MPVVVVSGGESKVRCCEEQYCVGTWDAHESGKLDVYCQSCGFPGSPALAGQFFTTEPPGELLVPYYLWFFFFKITSVKEASWKDQILPAVILPIPTHSHTCHQIQQIRFLAQLSPLACTASSLARALATSLLD